MGDKPVWTAPKFNWCIPIDRDSEYPVLTSLIADEKGT